MTTVRVAGVRSLTIAVASVSVLVAEQRTSTTRGAELPHSHRKPEAAIAARRAVG